MKVVLYDTDGSVFDIEEGLTNVVVDEESNSFKSDQYEAHGLHKQVLVLDDHVKIKKGEKITDEHRNNKRNIKPKNEVKERFSKMEKAIMELTLGSFNDSSVVVEIWLEAVMNGTYRYSEVPDLANLRDLVSQKITERGLISLLHY